jgi:hypothetical protein
MADSNGSGLTGIVGVVIGALLVGVFVFFVFGQQLGVRSAGKDVNIRVEAPKVPAPSK